MGHMANGRPRNYHHKRTHLMLETSTQCHYCGVRLFCKTCEQGDETMRPATKDHVVPIKAGATHGALSNLVLACEPCNQRKAARSLAEFNALD